MVEGKKISELGLVTNINDSCCFPLLSNGATKRITFAVLLENILAQLTIPENQEIKTLKEKVNNFNSSIELTDKEIEEIKNRCIELQKEIDSQDEIVVKYIKLFEELKEAYNRIEAEGMIIDGKLDVDSEHAISNKAVAQLIPAQANKENKLADKNFVNNSIQEIATNLTNKINDFASILQWKLLASLSSAGNLSSPIPDTANEIYAVRRSGATFKDFSFILPLSAIPSFGNSTYYIDNFITGMTYGIQINPDKTVKLNSTLDSGAIEIYYR